MKTIEFTTIDHFLGNAYWLAHLFYQLKMYYNEKKLSNRKKNNTLHQPLDLVAFS